MTRLCVKEIVNNTQSDARTRARHTRPHTRSPEEKNVHIALYICTEGVERDNEETRKNHSGCQVQSQGPGDILLPFGAYTASVYKSLSKSP